MGSNLFTYGTLMVPEVFLGVVGKNYQISKAVLLNFARYKVSGQSYPGITPENGASVEGIIYLDVGSKDFVKLNRFEGEMYDTEEVSVKTESGKTVSTLVYVVKPKYKALLSGEKWSFSRFVKDHLETFLGFDT